MSDRRGVVVTVPIVHQASFRQARVLEREGLLRALMVPLELGGARSVAARLPGPGRRLARYLEAWSRGPRARSGARVAALACAAGFRLAHGQHRTDRLQPLLDWRARDLDRSTVRALRRLRPAAVLTLEALSPRTLATAHRLGIRTVNGVNYDCWGVAAQLQAELASTSDPAARSELSAELRREAVARTNRELALSDHILLESTRMQSQLGAMGVEPARTTVLGQAVDTSAFVPTVRDSSARPVRVVYVGRVCYGKGLTYVAQAVAAAGDTVERLVVVGWDTGSVPALRARLAPAEFTGGLTARGVRQQLARADVFVLGTLADALPRAVLEAMAAGLPVVVTHESGYADIVRDGVDGFLVPARDADAMAARLRLLSQDGALRRRMGAAARARAAEYSWERYEERLRASLGRMLGEPA